ncbi:hypothetical protein [Runella slithyformis]|uniref:Uncharacterized protein n=1 Tax=Runella slithyformis (strain ATCC 29530 / DSM 19594 / LMG 11500 / NCIMB 11436 / LSU 4) TaxID=761193 RepID=A0A7U3ZQ82_RUNSL|nr:hypothetical protein [Runella slithyformis]AEI51381.1 hypothetical protein Runsl_5075 [Runella slithyformis DSM 19594]
MTIAGVSDVYSKSNDLLNVFFGINVSESQVYRVTDCMENQLPPDLFEDIKHSSLQENQRVYASIDGGMIQPDQGWQEVNRDAFSGKGIALQTAPKMGIRFAVDLANLHLVVI